MGDRGCQPPGRPGIPVSWVRGDQYRRVIQALRSVRLTGLAVRSVMPFVVRADHVNINSSNVVVYVGGNYNQNRNYGLFYSNMNSASNSNDNIGARHLPNVIGN